MPSWDVSMVRLPTSHSYNENTPPSKIISTRITKHIKEYANIILFHVFQRGGFLSAKLHSDFFDTSMIMRHCDSGFTSGVIGEVNLKADTIV